MVWERGQQDRWPAQDIDNMTTDHRPRATLAPASSAGLRFVSCMRAIFLVAVLATAYSCAAAVAAPDSHYTILPVSEARAAIDQCSRTAPDHVTGFWRPTPEQVEATERALPTFLRVSGHKIALRDFFHQYVGVVVRGRRLIYLNAFPYPQAGTADARDAKSKAYTACDGAESFWGAEFDPATNTFRNPDFNGVA